MTFRPKPYGGWFTVSQCFCDAGHRMTKQTTVCGKAKRMTRRCVFFVSRYTEDCELHLPTLTLRAHPIVRHVPFVPGIYSMVTRYDMFLTRSTTTQPKQPQGIMHMQSE